MKTDFISTVSHELRTPLTSILGFTKIIAKRLDERGYPAVPEPDPATDRAMTQVRGNLDIIVTEGDASTALINDLLDLAKMEAGRVEWRDDEVDVDAVVRQVAATVHPSSRRRTCPWTSSWSPSSRRSAATGTASSRSSSTCCPTPASSPTTGAVTVQDAPGGHGRRRVGHRHRSGHRAGGPWRPLRAVQAGRRHPHRQAAGHRAGAADLQGVVEHHGGHLDVESEVGRGTTFSFTLPLPIERAKPPRRRPSGPPSSTPAPAARPSRQLRALAGPTARRTSSWSTTTSRVRQLLRQELEGHGYVVHEAADGHEGFRMARALGPDLVTLDVMMPDVNGFDVAAALRQDPATMRIPLMMISVVNDEGRARAVGVDSYLAKPIDSVDLLEQVETLLAQGSQQRHVVVADPDSAMVETLGSALAAHGMAGDPRRQPRTPSSRWCGSAPDVVIARADPADPSRLVDELRADPATEHAVVVLYE